MAKSTITPTRRKFLGHLAGGAAVVAVAAGTARVAQALGTDNPDAELITLCEQHDELQGRLDALYEKYNSQGQDVPEELLAPLYADQHGITEDILELRATTVPGLMALAKSLALYAPEMIEDPVGSPEEMLAMLLRDMTAAHAAGGAV